MSFHLSGCRGGQIRAHPWSCQSELSASIGVRHKIKRAGDRLLVATALFENIETIHTFDGPLLALDGQIGNPGLRITAPDPNFGLTLFENTDGQEAD